MLYGLSNARCNQAGVGGKLMLLGLGPGPSRDAAALALGGRAGTPVSPFCASYSWLILARNSLLVAAFASLSISNSMASTGDSGFRTLRRTQIRCRSSLGISSSSFLV